MTVINVFARTDLMHVSYWSLAEQSRATPGGLLMISGATFTAAGGWNDFSGSGLQALGGVNREGFANQALLSGISGGLGYFLAGTPGAYYLAGVSNALVGISDPDATNQRCSLD